MSKRLRVTRETWEDDGAEGWSVDLYVDGKWGGGCWWPTWDEAMADTERWTNELRQETS